MTNVASVDPSSQAAASSSSPLPPWQIRWKRPQFDNVVLGIDDPSCSDDVVNNNVNNDCKNINNDGYYEDIKVDKVNEIKSNWIPISNSSVVLTRKEAKTVILELYKRDKLLIRRRRCSNQTSQQHNDPSENNISVGGEVTTPKNNNTKKTIISIPHDDELVAVAAASTTNNNNEEGTTPKSTTSKKSWWFKSITSPGGNNNDATTYSKPPLRATNNKSPTPATTTTTNPSSRNLSSRNESLSPTGQVFSTFNVKTPPPLLKTPPPPPLVSLLFLLVCFCKLWNEESLYFVCFVCLIVKSLDFNRDI